MVCVSGGWCPSDGRAQAANTAAADKEAFVARFDGLVAEIIADLEQLYPDFDKGAIAWFRRVLDFNCLGGEGGQAHAEAAG
jgi:hypothetical protein